VGACVGEEMDEDIDAHAEMVGVGLCTGAGVVSGAGTSSNDYWHRECLVKDKVAGVSHLASGID